MSLPDDDRPPPPAAPRDPLQDDPVFAEIVEPVSAPQFAEAVDPSDLPVAEVVRPTTRPKAVPVRTRPAVPTFPPPSPAAETAEPPKPQWFAACSVLGCLGAAIIGSIALLAFIAITLLSQIGQRIADRKKDAPPTTTQTKSYMRLGPIAPTSLGSDKTLKLSGAVDAVGRGAGGRLLLLRVPGRQELNVFDVNKGELLAPIPLGEQKSLFAAGARKLFVFKPGAGKLERIDLSSGQSDSEVPLPKGIKVVDALVIGPGSEGPLYAFSPGSSKQLVIHVIDQSTLEVTGNYKLDSWPARDDSQLHVRPSFDGTVLGVSSDKGAHVIHFDAEKKMRSILLETRSGESPILASPSPDGQYLYTNRGVYTFEGKPLLGTGRNNFFTFPTAHGSGLFLSLEVDNGKAKGFPQLHAAGDKHIDSLVALTKGDVSGDLPANKIRDVSADDRVHLWPGAGLLAVLPISNNELELFKVDLDEDLKSSSRAFLAFSTDPQLTVKNGGEWQYTPLLWGKSKPKLTLDDSPPGMTIKDGQITWTPVGVKGPVDVTIIAEVPNGPKATQKFKIWITE